jgi:uncharacterized protein YceH (UPF0502 family)
MTDDLSSPEQPPAPRWQPLPAVDRRVAGVLAEKAKTTPDAYPMSLNAICTACNQKSNRSPMMNLQPEDVEESLSRLRHLGAAGLVEGYGRVSKYRHYLYDWLGVDKVELAVMAELLLRGTQTEGELRGRAARMEPIRDLAELRPVLASLKSKGLVIPLTPEGRGHVVTHALYQPKELETIKTQYGAVRAEGVAAAGEAAEPSAPSGPPSPLPTPAAPVSAAATPAAGLDPAVAAAVQQQLEELRSQVAELRSDLEDLSTVVQRTEDEFHRLRDELGA